MGSSESRIQQPKSSDAALLSLKLQRDSLSKLAAFLLSQQAILSAKTLSTLSSGDKNGALSILRHKNRLQKERESVLSASDTVEGMISSIRQAQHSETLLRTLKTAQVVLADISSRYSVQDAKKLMQQTAESVQNVQEITNALNPSSAVDEVEDQMSEMEQQQLDIFQAEIDIAKLQAAPDVDNLPDIVTPTPIRETRKIVKVDEDNSPMALLS